MSSVHQTSPCLSLTDILKMPSVSYITKPQDSPAAEMILCVRWPGNGCPQGVGRAVLHVWIGLVLDGIVRWDGDRLPKLRKVYDEMFFYPTLIFENLFKWHFRENIESYC